MGFPLHQIGAIEISGDAPIIQAMNVQFHIKSRNVLCAVEDKFPFKVSSPEISGQGMQCEQAFFKGDMK